MWNDMENMEGKLSWIVKRYGKYRRKASWIVKRYGKYRRKLWNEMENMEEK
jgi:rRNA maturation protein Nop10